MVILRINQIMKFLRTFILRSGLITSSSTLPKLYGGKKWIDLREGVWSIPSAGYPGAIVRNISHFPRANRQTLITLKQYACPWFLHVALGYYRPKWSFFPSCFHLAVRVP